MVSGMWSRRCCDALLFATWLRHRGQPAYKQQALHELPCTTVTGVALYPCATFVLWPVPCHDPVKLTFTGGPRAYKLGPCRGCAESRLYWFAGRPRQGALAAPAELSVSFHMLAVATPVTKTGFPELAVLPSGFRHPEFSHLAEAAARSLVAIFPRPNCLSLLAGCAVKKLASEHRHSRL